MTGNAGLRKGLVKGLPPEVAGGVGARMPETRGEGDRGGTAVPSGGGRLRPSPEPREASATDREPGVLLVLGVDPGTAVTGYGVVKRRGDGSLRLLECGVLRTSAGEPLPSRIRDIFTGVEEVIERFSPDAVSVEDVFQGKNVRSALTLGHARGAILLAAALRDIPIAEYSPREIKKVVVGTGSATKDQVGYMVQRHLRLRTPPSPADAADGVAAALCHCILASSPLP